MFNKITVIFEKYVMSKFEIKSLNLISKILIAISNFKNEKDYHYKSIDFRLI
jgi:hypothetical protein